MFRPVSGLGRKGLFLRSIITLVNIPETYPPPQKKNTKDAHTQFTLQDTIFHGCKGTERAWGALRSGGAFIKTG